MRNAYDWENLPTAKEGWSLSGKLIPIAVAFIVTFVTILFIGVFAFGWFQKTTANFRGEVGQAEKILADPNYRIAKYDHFFDLCATIKAKEATIENLQGERETATDKRKEQINSTIMAIKSQRAESIQEFNADSAKEETAAHFKASGLPYRLDIKEETECEVE